MYIHRFSSFDHRWMLMSDVSLPFPSTANNTSKILVHLENKTQLHKRESWPFAFLLHPHLFRFIFPRTILHDSDDVQRKSAPCSKNGHNDFVISAIFFLLYLSIISKGLLTFTCSSKKRTNEVAFLKKSLRSMLYLALSTP